MSRNVTASYSNLSVNVFMITELMFKFIRCRSMDSFHRYVNSLSYSKLFQSYWRSNSKELPKMWHFYCCYIDLCFSLIVLSVHHVVMWRGYLVTPSFFLETMTIFYPHWIPIGTQFDLVQSYHPTIGRFFKFFFWNGQN